MSFCFFDVGGSRWIKKLGISISIMGVLLFFLFQAEDGIRDYKVTGVQTCALPIFASRTVVFLGISADDVAAGGHLERLKELGIKLGSHYWITARRDNPTDSWAEAVGIQIGRASCRERV